MKRLILLIALLAISTNWSQSNNLPSSSDILINTKRAVDILQTYYDTSWECSQKTTNPWKHKNIWNAYNTLEALIDYSIETGDTTLLPVIVDFVDNKCAYNDSKYAGYDDAQWTGISLIKAYKLTKRKKYLKKAIGLWEYIISNAWGTDNCSGGFWWNIEKTYKNAITNELFIVFSTMLFFETKDPRYNSWAIRTWEWFVNTGMIASDTYDNRIKNLVNDGIGRNCKNHGGSLWTYNQSALIGGLVNLWTINKDDEFLTTAINVANSSIDYFTQNGILVEKPNNNIILEDLNTDQQQFKGIFCRYISELYKILQSNNTFRSEVSSFLFNNYSEVVSIYPDYRIGSLWNQVRLDDNNAITQTSGVDLFVALIKIMD